MKNLIIAISIFVLVIVSINFKDIVNLNNQDKFKTIKADLFTVEMRKKFTEFYKNASDAEIDKFIQEQVDARASILPVHTGIGVTLYRITYLKRFNSVLYGYEVDGEALNVSEQELLASSDIIKYNFKEHHVNYFCTYPVIRMELDIGIKFEITILSKSSKYLTNYTITKDDCSSL